MVLKLITFILITVFHVNAFCQADTIKINSWNDLGKNGFYELTLSHPVDSSKTIYYGNYKDGKYSNEWLKLERGDKTSFLFSDSGIMTEKKEYFGGKLYIHEKIEIDSLGIPVLVRKKYRYWWMTEPLDYENRPINVSYYYLNDSLCDFTKFDYLVNYGEEQWCPENKFKTKIERFETQDNRHLIFRSTKTSTDRFPKKEIYYFDRVVEILVAQTNDVGEFELMIKPKQANQITLSFDFYHDLAESHPAKHIYALLFVAQQGMD